jgi:gamma-glutamylcyclotransferase (GGCT)/AIG2-like uncharacterized protein YtfP
MAPLYFGYGSNLDIVDWLRWCAGHRVDPTCLRPVRPGWLPDMELVFDYRSVLRGGGALGVQPAPGKLAAGHLFELTREGWEALDRKEGVPNRYRRLECRVLDPLGGEHRAVTYEVAPEQRTGFTPPTPEYLEICRRGRGMYGVPSEDLEAAAVGSAVPACNALFVYGTLMQGEQRFARLQGIAAISPAWVRGRLLDHGAYPGLVCESPASAVQGELVRCEDIAATLRETDPVELFHGFGHADNLYRRALVEAHEADGSRTLAWTYVTLQTQAPTIAGGSWRAHRAAAAS